MSRHDAAAPESDGSSRSTRWVIPSMLAAIAVIVVGAVMWDTRYTGDGDEARTGPTAVTSGWDGGNEAAEPNPTANEDTEQATTSDPPMAREPADLDEQGGVSADDVELLTVLYSLLGVSNTEESVAFLSLNIPEAEIARCMSDAGFQYLEGPSAAEQAAAMPSHTLSPDEYAATYGLGITGWDHGLYPSEPPDPNIEYVSSLTQGQRDAYNAAFWVCRGATPERVARSNAWNVSVQQFRDMIEADDRVVAASNTWRECMATAGFHYDSPLAMSASFYERMNSGIDRDELRQLHTEEITTAIANVPCEAAHSTSMRAVVLDRFDEYQQLYDRALTSGAVPEAQG